MLLIGPQSVPSILDQTQWPCGFYHFRDATPENEYFNPSIVTWRDRDYLIVRRRQGKVNTPGRNTLEAWLIKHNEPSRRFKLTVPTSHPDESHEDPRAFTRGDTIIVSCCNVVFDGSSFAHQCMFGLRHDFSTEIPTRVKFGHNGEQRLLNTDHEKNWAPFLHEGSIYFSYALSEGRHVVFRTKIGKPAGVTYGRAPRWDWGVLRGGTPPVFVNGLYWTFFHSSTYWYCNKRRYHMGVMAFESTPPFNVVRMSARPLLSGSELDPRLQHMPLVVFPGGAICRDSKWHVVLGINDCRCAWMQIPHRDVEQACYVF